MKLVLPLLVALGANPVLAQELVPLPETPSMGAEEAMTPLEKWESDPAAFLQADDIDPSAFKWRARPVIVFADSPADPRFAEQLELLAARPQDLVDRDVVVILDANPGANSDLRRKLRPRGFQLVLIGKDGGIKLRKPFPWDVRELSRVIDKMPMRKREVSESR